LLDPFSGVEMLHNPKITVTDLLSSGAIPGLSKFGSRILDRVGIDGKPSKHLKLNTTHAQPLER
jgi:hypothetical protein